METGSFKRILATILRGWRILVVGVLLAACVGGAAMFMGKSGEVNTDMGDYEKLEALLSGMKERQDEMDNGYLMELDPYTVVDYRMNVYIGEKGAAGIVPGKEGADSATISTAVLAAYVEGFDGSEMLEALARELNIAQPRYCAELARVGSLAPNLLVIRSNGKDEKEAEALAMVVWEMLQEMQPAVEETIAPHSLNIADTIVTDTYNSLVAARQEAFTKESERMTGEIKRVTHEMDMIQGQTAAKGKREIVVTIAASALLGLALAACVVLLLNAFSGVVRSGLALQDASGLPCLGEMSIKKKAPPERWADRMEGLIDTGLNETEKAQILYERLCSLVRETGGKRILLTGTVETEQIEALTRRLEDVKADDSNAITLEARANILCTPETIRDAHAYDCAVLVEKRGKTLLAEMGKEIEQLCGAGTEPAGFILL